MPREIEYVSIEKSKLYRIGRKRDLAKLLSIETSELIGLAHDTNYKEWSKKQPGKKDRTIEEPLPLLAKTLSELQSVLSKVETPPYLMSGKKRIKPRDNAEIHQFGKYVTNVDIERFFQSTKREFVFLAFKNDFQQTSDVASLIADIATYKGHIPTGTATSQLMAFWAYRKTFDRIYKLCVSKNIKMSVWVDDITFSSDKPFPNNWVRDVTKIMAEVCLTLKASKTKKYKLKDFKTVTGSAISPDGRIVVKNEKRKEIIDLLKNKKVEDLRLREARQLFGKLVAQRQNETAFFENVYQRCKVHLRKLEKQAAIAKTQKPFRRYRAKAA